MSKTMCEPPDLNDNTMPSMHMLEPQTQQSAEDTLQHGQITYANNQHDFVQTEVEPPVLKLRPSPCAKPMPGHVSRDGFGSTVPLCVNMWKLNMAQNATVFLYEVAITDLSTKNGCEVSRAGGKECTKLRRQNLCYRIMSEALEKMKRHGKITDCAYDRGSMLICARKLHISTQQERVELKLIPPGEQKERLYKVMIKSGTPNEINLTCALQKDNQDNCRLQMQIIQCITSQHAFYQQMVGVNDLVLMGDNLVDVRNTRAFPEDNDRVLVNGINKSVKLVEGDNPHTASLVIQCDRTTAALYKQQSVPEYIVQHLHITPHVNMTPIEHTIIITALNDLSLITSHNQRPVKVNAFAKSADQVLFQSKEGDRFTVQNYMRQKYGIELMHPELPCVEDGGALIPMELVQIAPNQRVPMSKQTQSQMQHQIKHCAIRPDARLESILNLMKRANISEDNRMYQMFGFDLMESCMAINGRLLPMPTMAYSNTNTTVNDMAEWSIEGCKWLVSGFSAKWAVLSFVPIIPEIREVLDQKFGSEAVRTGIEICPRPHKFEECTEETLRQTFATLKQKGYDFVLSVLPDNGIDLHRYIKLAELDFDMQTQNLKRETVLKIIGGKGKQVMTNLLAKTNMKLGGVNTQIHTNKDDVGSIYLDMEVLYLGVDVSHPPSLSSFERSRGILPREPSIVGLVANSTGEMFGYCGQHWAQDPTVESVNNMTSHVADQIRLYARNNSNKLPTKIMYFRDGVSEGQFAMVLEKECPQIKEAFAVVASELNWEQEMKMNTVVVIKRHHTRLFPERIARRVSNRSSTARDRSPTGIERRHGEKNKTEGNAIHACGDSIGRGRRRPIVTHTNIQPGTVVDTQCVSKSYFEFFLTSHTALQGTVRPVRYVVLENELDMSCDEMQAVCNSLCYGHSIVNKAIALPAPIKGADDMAKRGKNLMAAILNIRDSNEEQVVDWNSMAHSILIPYNHKLRTRKHWA